MGLIRSIVSVVVVLFAAILGAAVPSQALAARDLPVVSHHYDDGHVSPIVISTTTERGPPAPHHRDTTYDPDGLRLLGVLARPDAPTPPPTFDYDDVDRFVQTARGSRVARERASGAEAGSAVVRRLVDAANGGRTVAMGRNMADR